jgi:hypothetical protein
LHKSKSGSSENIPQGLKPLKIAAFYGTLRLRSGQASRALIQNHLCDQF